MPTVSVALCTYNGERYLSEQLGSMLRQTRLPDELVVGDDGSNDRTEALVGEFARSAPFPVIWERNPAPVGSTANFERTAKLCRYDLIAFADQDDSWLPNKLQEAEQAFAASPRLLARFTDALLADSELQPTGARLWERVNFTPDIGRELAEDRADMNFFKSPFVTGATMVIRRALLDMAVPFPTGLKHVLHDRWIGWIALAARGLAADPEPSMLYRQHKSQQVGVRESDSPWQRLRKRFRSHLGEFAEELTGFLLLRQRIGNDNIFNPAFIKLLDDRIAFLKGRSRLAEVSRPGRLPIIGAQLIKGRYARQANGHLSALKDLLL